MKLCDINPFIRYATIGDFCPANDFVYSYDSRLFYIVNGECTVTIEDTDYKIKKDTLMLWRAGTKYCFKMYDNIKIIILNFDYTQKRNDLANSIVPVMAREFEKGLITEIAEFENFEQFNQPLILENMQTIKKRLQKLVEKYNSINLYKHEYASSLLKEILTEIVYAASFSETKALNKIDTVIEYLKENYDKNITNTELGELTGYHSHYLNRIVLMHTGITLKQHLINIRIEAAKELLTQTDLSVYEISESCGFSNTPHFSNQFKAKCNISPVAYRNKYKNLI